MTSILENLQTAIVRQLREQMGAASATVVARRAADLDSQVEAAVQGALGLSVIVLDPCPQRVEPSVRGPVFLEIGVTVRVLENLLVNETGGGLLALAERVSQALHLWPLPSPWAGCVLRLADHKPWTNPISPMREAVALELHFLAAGSFAAEELR